MPDKELLRALTLPEFIEDAPDLVETKGLFLSSTPSFQLCDQGICAQMLEFWNISLKRLEIFSMRVLDAPPLCLRWSPSLFPLKVDAQSRALLPVQAYRSCFGERKGQILLETSEGTLEFPYFFHGSPLTKRSALWEVWPRYLVQTKAGYVDEQGVICQALFVLSQVSEPLRCSVSFVSKERTEPLCHAKIEPFSFVEIALRTEKLSRADALHCAVSSEQGNYAHDKGQSKITLFFVGYGATPHKNQP